MREWNRIRISVTMLLLLGTFTRHTIVVVEALSENRIVHGPRLGLITASTATIYWDSDYPAIGEVRWGTSEAYTSTLQETAAVTNHRVTLTDLEPAKTYHYQVRTGTATSQGYTFSTAALPDVDLVFASMADNRGKSVEEDLKGLPQPFIRICKLVSSRKVAFVLHAGDLFYGSIELEEQTKLYDLFKTATDSLAARTPLLISPGNHEMQPPNSPEGPCKPQECPPKFDPLALFNQQFAQPMDPDPLVRNYRGTCFSWDWGNSHFASIDTCRFDPSSKSPQWGLYCLSDNEIAWLDKDLRAAQERGIRHIFMFGHSHTFGKEDWMYHYLGQYPLQRDKFWSVLVKYKVDVYICGHEHLFNDELGKDGIVQWVNGNSGCIHDPEDKGLNQWTLWTIRGDTATAELIDDLGRIHYTRVIHSAQPSSPKTTQSITVTSPTTISLREDAGPLPSILASVAVICLAVLVVAVKRTKRAGTAQK